MKMANKRFRVVGNMAFTYAVIFVGFLSTELTARAGVNYIKKDMNNELNLNTGLEYEDSCIYDERVKEKRRYLDSISVRFIESESKDILGIISIPIQNIEMTKDSDMKFFIKLKSLNGEKLVVTIKSGEIIDELKLPVRYVDGNAIISNIPIGNYERLLLEMHEGGTVSEVREEAIENILNRSDYIKNVYYSIDGQDNLKLNFYFSKYFVEGRYVVKQIKGQSELEEDVILFEINDSKVIISDYFEGDIDLYKLGPGFSVTVKGIVYSEEDSIVIEEYAQKYVRDIFCIKRVVLEPELTFFRVDMITDYKEDNKLSIIIAGEGLMDRRLYILKLKRAEDEDGYGIPLVYIGHGIALIDDNYKDFITVRYLGDSKTYIIEVIEGEGLELGEFEEATIGIYSGFIFSDKDNVVIDLNMPYYVTDIKDPNNQRRENEYVEEVFMDMQNGEINIIIDDSLLIDGERLIISNKKNLAMYELAQISNKGISAQEGIIAVMEDYGVGQSIVTLKGIDLAPEDVSLIIQEHLGVAGSGKIGTLLAEISNDRPVLINDFSLPNALRLYNFRDKEGGERIMLNISNKALFEADSNYLVVVDDKILFSVGEGQAIGASIETYDDTSVIVSEQLMDIEGIVKIFKQTRGDNGKFYAKDNPRYMEIVGDVDSKAVLGIELIDIEGGIFNKLLGINLNNEEVFNNEYNDIWLRLRRVKIDSLELLDEKLIALTIDNFDIYYRDDDTSIITINLKEQLEAGNAYYVSVEKHIEDINEDNSLVYKYIDYKESFPVYNFNFDLYSDKLAELVFVTDSNSYRDNEYVFEYKTNKETVGFNKLKNSLQTTAIGNTKVEVRERADSNIEIVMDIQAIPSDFVSISLKINEDIQEEAVYLDSKLVEWIYTETKGLFKDESHSDVRDDLTMSDISWLERELELSSIDEAKRQGVKEMINAAKIKLKEVGMKSVKGFSIDESTRKISLIIDNRIYKNYGYLLVNRTTEEVMASLNFGVSHGLSKDDEDSSVVTYSLTNINVSFEDDIELWIYFDESSKDKEYLGYNSLYGKVELVESEQGRLILRLDEESFYKYQYAIYFSSGELVWSNTLPVNSKIGIVDDMISIDIPVDDIYIGDNIILKASLPGQDPVEYTSLLIKDLGFPNLKTEVEAIFTDDSHSYLKEDLTQDDIDRLYYLANKNVDKETLDNYIDIGQILLMSRSIIWLRGERTTLPDDTESISVDFTVDKDDSKNYIYELCIDGGVIDEYDPSLHNNIGESSTSGGMIISDTYTTLGRHLMKNVDRNTVSEGSLIQINAKYKDGEYIKIAEHIYEVGNLSELVKNDLFVNNNFNDTREDFNYYRVYGMRVNIENNFDEAYKYELINYLQLAIDIWTEKSYGLTLFIDQLANVISFDLTREASEKYLYSVAIENGGNLANIDEYGVYHLAANDILEYDTIHFVLSNDRNGMLLRGDKVLLKAGLEKIDTLVGEIILTSPVYNSVEDKVYELFTDDMLITLKDNITNNDINYTRTLVDRNYIVDKEAMHLILDDAKEILKRRAKDKFSDIFVDENLALIVQLDQNSYSEYGYRVTRGGFDNILYSVDFGVLNNETGISVISGDDESLIYFQCEGLSKYEINTGIFEVWAYVDSQDIDNESEYIKITKFNPYGLLEFYYYEPNSNINFIITKEGRNNYKYKLYTNIGYLGHVDQTAYYLGVKEGEDYWIFSRGVDDIVLYKGDMFYLSAGITNNSENIIAELIAGDSFLSLEEEVKGLFTDDTYTALNSGVTDDTINNLRMAVDRNFIVDKEELHAILDIAQKLLEGLIEV